MIPFEISQEKVRRFQNSLGILRRVAGFSVQDLAERAGLGKATVINLLHRNIDMSVTQYIALRYTLEAQVYFLSEDFDKWGPSPARKARMLTRALRVFIDRKEDEACRNAQKVIRMVIDGEASAWGAKCGCAELGRRIREKLCEIEDRAWKQIH